MLKISCVDAIDSLFEYIFKYDLYFHNFSGAKNMIVGPIENFSEYFEKSLTSKVKVSSEYSSAIVASFFVSS